MTGVDRRRTVWIFRSTAAIHLILALLFTALIFIDNRQILGISAWIKPLKFAVTGFIYLATLAFFSRDLPDSLSERKANLRAWIISLMISGETLFIGIQSARGVQSHFNQATALDGIIYSVMGMMIIVNTVSFSLLMRHFFHGTQKIGGAYLAGIKWGAVLFLVGSIVGGVMSGLNRHTIGLPDGGPGLPLVNFSTGAGDLRIAHFLGLHALQILPLAGWLLGKSDRPGAGRQTWVMGFGVLYAIGLGLIFLQALMGRPLLH